MSADHSSWGAVDHDLQDLRRALAGLAFPARQDEVLVELVSRRAPARLVRSVGALPRSRRYRSIEELLGDVEGEPEPPRPRAPWA